MKNTFVHARITVESPQRKWTPRNDIKQKKRKKEKLQCLFVASQTADGEAFPE